ncbi:uncharacterized protein LOC131008277 [Salvia miltiorrhiza]|uniref:uncharacterized protein LOC131008277 n=1 Tax=Salvia miltiorrhiza TaxID=226208 RepID=UPI0025AD43FE|nr:uncharacterized protein LOC131008277 [Salvia miltiorrhiza]
MSKGFYTIKFSTAEDKSIAKRSNVWNLRSGTLRLREWVRNFDPYKEISSLCQVWMRIYYLPVEYWTKEIISSIARSAGVPIKVDGATAHGEVGHYARVLVEVDLAPPLPESASVDCHDRSIYVEFGFEQLPAFCTKCKITRHNLDKCKKRYDKEANNDTVGGNKRTETVGAEVILNTTEEDAGRAQKNTTLEVSKQKPAWKPRENILQETTVVNRFDALAQLHIEDVLSDDRREDFIREKGDGLNTRIDDMVEEDASEEENHQAKLTENILSEEVGDKAADLQIIESDSQINRSDLTVSKGTEQVPPVKKRGRPPGQPDKEIKKQPPGMDSIKCRLRKAQETNIEPNPDAVESIKEQLYKAWEAGENPRDFVIANDGSSSAKMMAKIGARSWAVEVEKADALATKK